MHLSIGKMMRDKFRNNQDSFNRSFSSWTHFFSASADNFHWIHLELGSICDNIILNPTMCFDECEETQLSCKKSLDRKTDANHSVVQKMCLIHNQTLLIVCTTNIFTRHCIALLNISSYQFYLCSERMIKWRFSDLTGPNPCCSLLASSSLMTSSPTRINVGSLL